MMTIEQYSYQNQRLNTKQLTSQEFINNSNHLVNKNYIQNHIQKFSLETQNHKFYQVENSAEKMSVPIKEFQYDSLNSAKKKRTQSQSRLKSSNQVESIKQSRKLQKMPIKIINDKIQLENAINNQHFSPNIASNKFNKMMQIRQNPQNKSIEVDKNNHLAILNQQYKMLSFKEQFQLKQKSYKPKLSIFQRYNYQNYENYLYKNPFKKGKYDLITKKGHSNHKYKFPQNQKYNPDKGSSKNLQIIFCEAKYPQFVKKTNQLYEKSNRKSLQQNQHLQNHQIKGTMIDVSHSNSQKLLNFKNLNKWSYSTIKTQKHKDIKIKTKIFINGSNNKKSTLEKLLQQFKSLQKITLLQQQQRKIKSKRKNPSEAPDCSKTVFVSLIVDKYPFLQNLNRNFRNNLLKCLFEVDNVNDFSKISIHDYLKFNRIFISKDASIEELSEFVYNLLFKNSSSPSLEEGQRTLNQLNPKNKQKLQNNIHVLSSFFIQMEPSVKSLIPKFIQNVHWLLWTIDLIKDQ